MTTIKDYSKEIDSCKAGKNKNVAVLLQNMLTELYFSLILTFSPLLYTQGNLDFDDDFGKIKSKRRISSYDTRTPLWQQKRTNKKKNAL